MSALFVSHVDFHYSSPYSEVFSDLSLVLDSCWRTGLVGRNGRGKSTLLNLLIGDLQPAGGQINCTEGMHGFPRHVDSPDETAQQVARELVAPFQHWESEMVRLLEAADEASLDSYTTIHTRYMAANGYAIDGLIEKECLAMGLDLSVLKQPFNQLSLGQQTRIQILSLFLHEAGFPLIDEPTNHLDLQGRQQLADYLAQKPGFILASHDRTLLDACTDHIVSINRSDVRINQGNWSSWHQEMARQTLHEERDRRRIEKDVKALKSAAQQRRQGAGKREAEKYGSSWVDTGYIGHKAAKQMKRALAAEQRIDKQLDEKTSLLKNREKDREITVSTKAIKGRVLTLNNVDIGYDARPILRNLCFTLDAGERVAFVGSNGSGKSSLINAIESGQALAGTLSFRGRHISRSWQQPLWQTGCLKEHLRESDLDETRFRQFLGLLDVRGEIFDQPLETLSQGQLKKVDLVRSLLTPAELLLWDEPMNYLDVDSRQMLEAGILRGGATMILVEHDATFIEQVATRVINLDDYP